MEGRKVTKPLKFVLSLPKCRFFCWEKAFHARKKSGKMTLPPLKEYFSYAPVNGLGRSCVDLEYFPQ